MRHGAKEDAITVVRVPGAWELPAAVRRVAAGKRVDAVVALGAVIRGSTPHFDYVAGEAAGGLASVAAATAVPVAFIKFRRVKSAFMFRQEPKEPDYRA